MKFFFKFLRGDFFFNILVICVVKVRNFDFIIVCYGFNFKLSGVKEYFLRLCDI